MDKMNINMINRYITINKFVQNEWVTLASDTFSNNVCSLLLIYSGQHLTLLFLSVIFKKQYKKVEYSMIEGFKLSF